MSDPHRITVMECPSCRGAGCPKCRAGKIELKGCPKQHIIEDALIVLQVLASEKLPVAGGYLDQTQCYADVASFMAGEENHWRKVDK